MVISHCLSLAPKSAPSAAKFAAAAANLLQVEMEISSYVLMCASSVCAILHALARALALVF